MINTILFAVCIVVVVAIQAPTREQPHVVLHHTALNTFEAPAYHQDSKFVSFGDDVRHEFIVQLAEPVNESKEILERETGVQFGNYMPHNSYLLYVAAEKREAVRQHERTLWIGAFLPEYKIADILNQEDAETVLEHELFRFAIHYLGDKSQKQYAEEMTRRVFAQSPIGINIESIEESDAKQVILVTFVKMGLDHARRVAAYFAQMPDIHFIEPLGPTQYHLALAKLDTWSGPKGVGAPATLTGAGEIVAIGDNGITGTAPCLTNKLTSAGAPPDPHGTAMGAVSVGNGGIASGAKAYFVALSRGIALAGLATKFDAAVQAGAFVLASAAGAPATAYNAASKDIDDYLRVQPAAVAIFAAGNAPDKLTGPGYSKNALVVGATGVGPNRHIVGNGSPRIGTKDYRIKPDVVASGVGINTNGCGMAPGGTSMAAAAAAGAAALVRQYFVQGWYPLGQLTPMSESLGFQPSGALVKATLVHAAVPVAAAADAGGMVGAGTAPSEVQGFGRIQLDRALFINGTSTFDKMSVVDDNELEQGAEYRLCIVVQKPGQELRVTLAWMDIGADVAAGHTLINDLDLLVYELETGREWRGNDRSGFDHANTVEQVTFKPPKVGKYVIVVSGRTLREKQAFGLVATGGYSEQACVGSVVNPADNTYTSTFDFPKCPNGCSFFENSCQNGLCQCSAIGVGVDCSLLECPEGGCGLDGTCDFALGTCRCVQGKRGDGCKFSFTNLPPEEVFETRSTSIFRGQDVALFGGLFAFLYILGCVCAVIFGAVCGTKYLEMKRDAAARA